MTVRISGAVLDQATFVYGAAATEDSILTDAELAAIRPSRETRDRFENARELGTYQLDSATVDVVSRTLRPALRRLAAGPQRELTSLLSQALVHTGWTDMEDHTRVISSALRAPASVQRALLEILPEVQGTDLFNDMLRSDAGFEGFVALLTHHRAVINRFLTRGDEDIYVNSDDNMGLGRLLLEGETAGLSMSDTLSLLGFVTRAFPASENYVDVANALHAVMGESGPINATPAGFRQVVAQVRARMPDFA